MRWTVKTASVVALAISVIFAGVALPASAGEQEDAAVAAARSWLQVVDAGDYGASWEQAAAFFRNAVPKQQWRQQLDAVRTPLGAVGSRELLSAQHMTSLPGAPDGDYVVIQFKTSFANKKSAVETVTPMLEKDGVWRVSGYFIK